MSGNNFGRIFRLTSYGESHGAAVGGILDGCPAGLEVDMAFIQAQMARRRPGQSAITTQRREPDRLELLSGVFEGKTLGTPIAFMVRNEDQRSRDYDSYKDLYRPSHADYTYQAKYGHRDYRGSGRTSARETLSRVAGGAFARLLLREHGVEIVACTTSVGPIEARQIPETLTPELVDKNPVRCPDEKAAKEMISYIEKLKKEGDSTGGVVSCTLRNVPPGLGDPVFRKLQAELAGAMLSINAAKGFQYGSGFAGTEMRGSEHNDLLYYDQKSKRPRTRTNHSGGIQGGISNGEDIYFRVAFKPVSTIMIPQQSINTKMETTRTDPKGRHDPCVAPRAVPVVEAMAALCLADALLMGRSSQL